MVNQLKMPFAASLIGRMNGDGKRAGSTGRYAPELQQGYCAEVVYGITRVVSAIGLSNFSVTTQCVPL